MYTKAIGFIISLISNLALNISDTIINHDCVLLKPHLLLLQLTRLLLQESDLVQIILLQLPEIFLKIIDVLKNFLKDVIEALSALMLQGRTLRPQQLGVFLIIIQLFDAFFDVYLWKTRFSTYFKIKKFKSRMERVFK